MPRPIYILCAENIVIDRETNLVSVSNIIEKMNLELKVQKTPAGERSTHEVHTGKAKAIAVWGVAKGDDGKKFESKFVITMPGVRKPVETEPTPFRFEKGKLLHRFILSLQLPPVPESGTLKIESFIRKIGTAQWRGQSYEIVVELAVDDKDNVMTPESLKELFRRQA